jgi:hypothetical protein
VEADKKPSTIALKVMEGNRKKTQSLEYNWAN